jgi:hypothetical protein
MQKRQEINGKMQGREIYKSGRKYQFTGRKCANSLPTALTIHTVLVVIGCD